VTLPVAILAGGLATRLGPITRTTPKALVEVAGRPFVEHQLALLARGGVRRVVLCLGHLGEQVEAVLGSGSRFGVELAYAHDGGQLRGTGGALRRALPVLGEAFLVMYGDSWLECDYADVERTFLASARLGLMTVFRNEGRWDASNVEFRDGRIVRYDKKARGPELTHIDWGLGAFRAEALETYPPDTRLDLAAVYGDLLARGELAAYEVPRRFYEIGSPEGLEETRLHLASWKEAP
jgi:N-acetyl-alpha-D-muramate 1-phosphate uridylyltransferase